MHTRRLIAALGLAAAALASTATTATAEPTPTKASTAENDCSEIAITRATNAPDAQAVIPSRYGISETNPGVGRLFVHTYTCQALTIDGQPVVGGNRPTTISIGSVAVNTLDGTTLAGGFNAYILWFGTDNPVLFAKYQQLGLPVRFLKPDTGTTTTLTTDGAITAIDWAIRNPGINYDVVTKGAIEPPTTTRQGADIFFWYDTGAHDLRLTYHNTAIRPSSSAPVRADLRGATLATDLMRIKDATVAGGPLIPPSEDPDATINLAYTRGSWTAVLKLDPDLQVVD